MSVNYNGTNYYYVANIQGDIMAILNTSGSAVVSYTYDAWGKLYSTTGTLADTLGEVNPLTYRGYVIDREIGMFYLQSRYYSPDMGRFLNPDSFTSTGQGILGNNMFTYCGNNPVQYVDPCGRAFVGAGIQLDVSTGAFECGIEIIIYWDDEVCQDENLVVAIYVYEGMCVNLDELY